MTIVGAGRVGRALAARAALAGQACTLVDRTSGWDTLPSGVGPIVVAVRNDDLDAVRAATPAHRRSDLVFVQNGMIRPWLRERALADATRGLLFFWADHTNVQVGAIASPFFGRHAAQVVRLFAALDLPAVEVDPLRFAALELEKLIWIAAFGLLGRARGVDAAGVCDHHAEVLRPLVDELRAVGRAALAVDLPLDWLLGRLVAYARTIPGHRGDVKDWRWRNGWFDAAAGRLGVPTPVHRALLTEAGFGDRLIDV